MRMWRQWLWLLAVLGMVSLVGCDTVDRVIGRGPGPKLAEVKAKLDDKDWRGAQKLLNRLLHGKEIGASVYAAAIEMLLDADRPTEAYDWAVAGLKATPNGSPTEHAQLYRLKGAALLELQDPQGAVAANRAALHLDPTSPLVMNDLAYALVEQSDPMPHLDEANRLARRAVEGAVKAGISDVGYGVMLDTLGWIQFKMGEWTSAAANLGRAADLAPQEPVILYHQARLYESRGRDEEAIILLKRAIRIDPSLDIAARALKELLMTRDAS